MVVIEVEVVAEEEEEKVVVVVVVAEEKKKKKKKGRDVGQVNSGGWADKQCVVSHARCPQVRR